MRKLALGLVLALAITGLATAQAYGPPAGSPMYGQVRPGVTAPQLQAKNIEGKLSFIDSNPAIVTKEKTFLLDMRAFFYYAYTDGIKAGDTMKLDGYELPAVAGQDKPFFMVTKAVINGKTYDLTAAFSRSMHGGQGGMMGRGGSMMGQGGYGPKSGRGRGGRW